MRVDGDRFTRWSDAGYPRPQLCRPEWSDLGGVWEFAADPCDVGFTERWFQEGVTFPQTIEVPFPPGSELSGTGADADQDVIWYRRVLTVGDLVASGWSASGQRVGERTLLHFEAVDFITDVWVDSQHAARHEGGFTPFDVDVSGYLPMDVTTPVGDTQERDVTLHAFTVVVRAETRRSDLSQPRGKQDWREQAHGIWYERSAGIWRDVWLETVPASAVAEVYWQPDVAAGAVTCEVTLAGRYVTAGLLTVSLRLDGNTLGSVQAEVHGDRATVTIAVPTLANRMEWDSLLWSPDHPVLVDADLVLHTGNGTDRVISYLGMRTVDCDARYLRLNQLPVYVRGVLDQGYWPASRLASPSADALRQDLQIAKDLGFNTVRAHQRTPDRRYLTWADRLGVMVWGEFPAAFAYDDRAVARTVVEWMQVVRRDRSHPSLVVWVPFNESWGVPRLSDDAGQQAFVNAVVELTRVLDPHRPVVANDGWEQLDTDLVTVHDYGATGSELAVNYADVSAVARTVGGTGPQGRPILLGSTWAEDRPVLVSEFGGISLNIDDPHAWGYAVVATPEDFDQVATELFDALHSSPVLAGFCWTQLADTGQETNGLCGADRVPKLDPRRIREIVHGPPEHWASQQRPRVIREVSAGGK